MYRIKLHSDSIVTMTMANRVLQETGTNNRFFDGVTYLTWEELDAFKNADSSFVFDVTKVQVSNTGYKAYMKELRLYNKKKRNTVGNGLKATNENKFIISSCRQTSAEDLSDAFSMLIGA